MIIPKEIKIGGLRYKVEIVEKLTDEDVMAMVDYQKQLIKVVKGEQQYMEANFLHEMFHAMNCQFSEERIEFLAISLHQIITDNPLMFKGGEQKHEKHRK